MARFIALVTRHDRATAMHMVRVGGMCGVLARNLGLDKATVEALLWAGAAHDVGKLRVPSSVLTKPSPLDESEWMLLRQHPEIGAAMLSRINSHGMSVAINAARGHHERIDGRGYPAGLARDRIPFAARMCSIVDAYDAMRMQRAYGRPLDIEEATERLVAGSGTQFDVILSSLFVEHRSEMEEIRFLVDSAEVGLSNSYETVRALMFLVGETLMESSSHPEADEQKFIVHDAPLYAV